MEESNPKPVEPPQVTFQHTPNFISAYANNVRFESTVWDLRVIFGEIDQSSGAEVVHQHTAISLPWSLVRLVAFYMQFNLVIHEAINGKVSVPPSQIPPVPPELTPEQEAENPTLKMARAMAIKSRDDFLASLR
jgi:hypothetical protein